MSSSLHDYHYRPLESKRHFRLLSVKVEEDYGFRYKIIHATLDDHPPYETVSYCWGSDVRDQPLLVNRNRTGLTTKSVAQALPRLSQVCETGYLWIDQLCIDQSSLVERGHQVAIMGQIYRKGYRVLVWLAESPTETPQLMDFLEKACAVALHHCTPGDNQGLDAYTMRLLVKGIEPLINGPEGSAEALRHQAFVQLFTHRWFTRAWVFQEMNLSRQGGLLFITMFVDKYILQAICEAVESIERKDSYRIYESTTKCQDVSGYRLFQKMSSFVAGPFCEDFADLIYHQATHAQATDPRDLIYSLLGLMKTSWENPPPLIEPEYTISLEAVYIRITAALVRVTEGLELLELLPHISGSELPSWVPIWNQQMQWEVICTDLNACLGRKYKWLPPGPTSELTVSGKIVDKVANVVDIDFDDNTGREIDHILPLDEVYRYIKASRPRGWQKMSRAGLLDVMLALGSYSDPGSGIELDQKLPSDDLAKELLATYDSAVHGRLSSRYPEASKPPTAMMRIAKIRSEFDQNVQRIIEGAELLKNRRVMMTISGKLGLVHRYVQPNDAITILHGSTLPVVLRATSPGRYQVICQCYVSGIMRGEAVQWDEHAADEFLLV